MGDKIQGEPTEAEIIEAAQAEKAFAAGFSDSDYEAPTEAGLDDKTPSVIVDKKTPALKPAPIEGAAPVEEGVTAEGPLTDEDWQGVPDILRKRFEQMADNLTNVTNIANSASGRANKLQSELQKQKNAIPTVAAKPTSQQIHEAMADKTKREALRKEWPDFAEAFDEIDKTVSTAVGSAIDDLRNEFSSHRQELDDHDIKRDLDNKHPGWENTVLKDDFKDWLYRGGPTPQERTEYENTLGYAQSLSNNSPQESEQLFGRANEIYTNMLVKYPNWALDKGSLYGDPSGEAALKLLDMHKAGTVTAPITSDPAALAANAQQLKNQQRLADNVAPTSGAPRQVQVDPEEDVMAAFSAGFNS